MEIIGNPDYHNTGDRGNPDDVSMGIMGIPDDDNIV